MYKKLSLLFLGVFALISLSAQEPCGTMERLEWKKQVMPEVAQRLAAAEEAAATWREDHASHKTQTVLTIPVVVHVVYKDSLQNISDAQIQSQIDVLNEDYRRFNADTANARSVFDGLGADVEIEFCLASTDPDGNPTTGVTRTFSQGGVLLGYFGPTDDVKTASSGGVDPWPTDQYLNIWVCDLLPILAGYAQFPGDDSLTDGVVIGFNFFGTNGTAIAPYDKGRTATHEIGHWLGLRHIWGDGDCSADDFVNDTPVAASATQGSCDSLKNTCTDSVGDLPDMIENYMDYSLESCMNMFTHGQKDRMWSFLNTDRLSLFSSNGCNVVANREEALQNGSIQLWPNPATESVQIQVRGISANEITIRVYDLLGKSQLQTKQNLNSGVVKVDLSDLPTGVYTVQVSAGGQSFTQKLMVSR